MLFVAGWGIEGRLKRMQKSNPPERVLRLAGVTGFPAQTYNPQLMRQACGYNSPP